MEGGDKLTVAKGERGGEGTVGDGESRDRRAIASGGGGQVGNGVYSILLIDMVVGVSADMIGGVVDGTSSGGLQFTQFLMGGGKEGFELGPGIVGWIISLPKFAIVIE